MLTAVRKFGTYFVCSVRRACHIRRVFCFGSRICTCFHRCSTYNLVILILNINKDKPLAIQSRFLYIVRALTDQCWAASQPAKKTDPFFIHSNEMSVRSLHKAIYSSFLPFFSHSVEPVRRWAAGNGSLSQNNYTVFCCVCLSSQRTKEREGEREREKSEHQNYILRSWKFKLQIYGRHRFKRRTRSEKKYITNCQGFPSIDYYYYCCGAWGIDDAFPHAHAVRTWKSLQQACGKYCENRWNVNKEKRPFRLNY